jgi:hypothetical protein
VVKLLEGLDGFRTVARQINGAVGKTGEKAYPKDFTQEWFIVGDENPFSVARKTFCCD